MKAKTLESKWHIDYPEEFRYRFINSTTEKEVLHTHQYYEIFLTLTDNITHMVNNRVENLKIGSLVFVRPSDIHLYTHEDGAYQFINLAFTKELANSLFAFLANDIPISTLIKSRMPPTILLSSAERKHTQRLFQSINFIPHHNHSEKKLACKLILTTLFTKYFTRFTSNKLNTDIPLWLMQTCEQMKSIDYFQNGIPAMVSLSGKTYEHLSRSMKKYYNITVTDYINNLRLNCASNLLLNSNYSITEIFLECGFNSASYFVSCFKEKYGVTPSQYRKNKYKK